MGICVGARGEGGLEMGICKHLGPGVEGVMGWVSVCTGDSS